MRAQPHMNASEHAKSLDAYIDAGVEKALSLGNRGPMRYDAQGKVHPDILSAYWQLVEMTATQTCRGSLPALCDFFDSKKPYKPRP